LLLYTQDYDDQHPQGAYTRFADKLTGLSPDGKRYSGLWAVLPYVTTEDLFVCPSREGWNYSTTNPSLDTHRPRVGSYSSNHMLLDTAPAAVPSPAETIAYCDGYNPWIDCWYNCSSCGCSELWNRIGRGSYQGNATLPTAWHNEGLNIAFADGHAKWQTLGGLRYEHWVPPLPPGYPGYGVPITRQP